MSTGENQSKKRKSRFSEAANGQTAIPVPVPMQPVATISMPSDKVRQAMQFQQSTQLFIANLSSVLATARKEMADRMPAFMPAPLLLDSSGRQIDETGNVVAEPTAPVATLQANLRGSKETVNPYLSHRSVEKEDGPTAFDPRLKITQRASRSDKAFEFVKSGTYVKQGDKMRITQARKIISGLASGRNPNAHNQDGITTVEEEEEDDAMQVAPRVGAENGILELPSQSLEPVPGLEPWDEAFLPKEKRIARKKSRESAASQELVPVDELAIDNCKEWKYVQHPIPIVSATETLRKIKPVPVMLTKQERKRLRRQTRMEREREKQDKIALGLIPAPEAKVKLSNMMRVLGDSAVADPSKVEKQVLAQVAQRQKNHDMRNLARKLTPAERKEKKKRKMMEDTSLESHVALFRVKDLSNTKNRFKVDVNAQENHLTGGVLLCNAADTNLVVVEGGPKAIKRFVKLMMNRIDWFATNNDQDSEDEEDELAQTQNKCELVWQGTVVKKAFSNFRFQECKTVATARKVMEAKGVAHYWDMVVKPEQMQGETLGY